MDEVVQEVKEPTSSATEGGLFLNKNVSLFYTFIYSVLILVIAVKH